MNRFLSFLLLSFILTNSFAINGNQLCVEEIALNYLYETVNDTIFWNKIHAIEFLIDLGFNEDVDAILNELEINYENIPEKRIGYLRCRVKNEKNTDKKNRYIEKILQIYMNPSSPDIIHAVESLAKLSVSLKNIPQLEFLDSGKNNICNAYLNWSYVCPDSSLSSIDYTTLFKTLQSDNSDYRRIMAYGLKFLGKMEREPWQSVAERAINQPTEYPFSTYLLSGALSTCPEKERKSHYINLIKQKLRILAKRNESINQYEAYVALGNFADQEDFNFIQKEFLKLYSCKNGAELDKNKKDVLSAMSYALLKTSGHKKN
ncbi:hypothetical protein KCV26_02815 [Petrimonas sulfuriphila]|uniref:hypothetical protein n=1 Tax=Petrimonas sulfuriphila TaxID=285070 RepID=UPI0032457EEA